MDWQEGGVAVSSSLEVVVDGLPTDAVELRNLANFVDDNFSYGGGPLNYGGDGSCGQQCCCYTSKARSIVEIILF